MKITLKKIGNSVGILIPEQCLAPLNWKIGDKFEIKAGQESIILIKKKPRIQYTLEELISKSTESSSSASKDINDWNNPEPTGKEVW